MNLHFRRMLVDVLDSCGISLSGLAGLHIFRLDRRQFLLARWLPWLFSIGTAPPIVCPTVNSPSAIRSHRAGWLPNVLTRCGGLRIARKTRFFPPRHCNAPRALILSDHSISIRDLSSQKGKQLDGFDHDPWHQIGND